MPLPPGRVLTAELASSFARIALGHVSREYPNKLDHVLHGPEDARTPRAIHPLFYGSFDWHSCVHGYWLLCRLYRRFPDLPERGQIATLLDRQLTPGNVAAEAAYLAEADAFERPYGWAWLLMLAAELTRHETARWGENLAPLTDAFGQRFLAFLPRATYPVRSGTHGNTAFALALALEYAEACGHGALDALARQTCRAWYGSDADCQAWEPGGDDFLSPALIEAVAMQKALPTAEFAVWLDRFLPRLGAREPKALFEPAVVSDRRDGKIVHLDGLNLSRAWCWRALARALAPADPRRAIALEAAEAHLAQSLPHVAFDYMGEHWLATFALLALEG